MVPSVGEEDPGPRVAQAARVPPADRFSGPRLDGADPSTADLAVTPPTGAPGWHRAAWIGFAVLFTYVVVLGGSWPGIYAVEVRIVSLLLMAVVLSGWAVLAWRRPEWRPRTAIWPAVVPPLGVFALSTLTSPFPRLGLEYLALAVLFAALYLLLVRCLVFEPIRARIGGLAATLGLAIGGAYIVTVVGLWIEWWSLVGRLETPPLRPLFAGLAWGNPNAMLAVEVLLLLVAAAGLGARTRIARGLLTAQVLVTLVVVVLTGSRAGWLALAGALIVVGLPWLVAAAPRDVLRRAAHSGTFGIGLSVFILVGLAAVLLLAPGVIARIEEGGDGGRPTYFVTALRMFQEAPLLGTGPGTWAARRIVHTRGGEIDYYIPHAHDVYLQTLAELGLVGALAGLAMIGSVAWLIVRGLRSDDAIRRRWAWAALFGVVYMGFHSFLDSYANMPSVLLLLVVPIAWLDGASERRLGLPRALAADAPVVAGVAATTLMVGCLLAVLVLARSEAIALVHERAVALIDAGEWEAGLELAKQAADRDPDIPAYHFTEGIAAAGAGDWRRALDAFQSAVVVDDLPQSWLGSALALAETGAPRDEVVDALRRAYRVGVQQPAVIFAVGRVYDRLGMRPEADTAYVAALGQLPSLAGDPDWTADAASASRFAAVVERALRSYPATAWELALMAGDPARARAWVVDAPDPLLALSVVEAWAGDREAVEAVLADADANVLDARKLAWAARLSARLGETDRVARYNRLLEIGIPDATKGYEVRIGRRGSPRDAAVGNRATNYGTYMYRRPTPLDPIVPGLPGLVRADEPEG
jgi:O-antigen ligase